MSVRKLNVRTCDLDESLDRAGFRHGTASIAERIGASDSRSMITSRGAGFAARAIRPCR